MSPGRYLSTPIYIEGPRGNETCSHAVFQREQEGKEQD
jgi:hypothetical protein